MPTSRRRAQFQFWKTYHRYYNNIRYCTASGGVRGPRPTNGFRWYVRRADEGIGPCAGMAVLLRGFLRSVYIIYILEANGIFL